MPRILIGSAYADMRLAPYVIAMALLAIDTRGVTRGRLGRLMIAGGLVFFLVRTASTTYNFRNYDALLQREFVAIDHIPDGARVASFITYRCGTWSLDRRAHLPSIALARRHIFTNDQFILSGAQLIQIRYKGGFPIDRDPTQLMKSNICGGSDLQTFAQSMAKLPRAGFDMIWVIGRPEDRLVDYSGLTPVWRNQDSILYRIER